MNFVVGIIFSFLYLLILFFAYFFLLLINELLVMGFDVNPLEWLKREIFEPVGRGLLELIQKLNTVWL